MYVLTMYAYLKHSNFMYLTVNFCFNRGDPAIVYLDGVNPPQQNLTGRRGGGGNGDRQGENGEEINDPGRKPVETSGKVTILGSGYNGNISSSPVKINPALKVNGHQHQMQLLQTIREDDGESR